MVNSSLVIYGLFIALQGLFYVQSSAAVKSHVRVTSNAIHDHALGLPTKFHPHPFSKSDIKISATTIKQPAGTSPTPITERGQRMLRILLQAIRW
jgi:hypothetical protein